MWSCPEISQLMADRLKRKARLSRALRPTPLTIWIRQEECSVDLSLWLTSGLLHEQDENRGSAVGDLFEHR